MPTEIKHHDPFLKTLELFQECAGRVPAYGRFLKAEGIDPLSIATRKDFLRLPIMDKENYILQNSLQNLCFDSKLDGLGICASSGTTGRAVFWPIKMERYDGFPERLERIFAGIWKMNSIPTLVIICLPMGIYMGGLVAYHCSLGLNSLKHYPSSVAGPGLQPGDALRVIKEVAPFYQQSLIISFRELTQAIINMGTREGIDFQKLNIRILLSGEHISEEWKKHICNRLGAQTDDLTRIFTLYASVDMGGLIGNETPFTVAIRRLAMNDRKLARALFGRTDMIPSLVEYDPMEYYIESVDGRLLMTTNAGVPLIRYDIKDSGGILNIKDVLQILRDSGNYDIIESEIGEFEDLWTDYPLVFITGRSDKAIIIDGCNIWEENAEKLIFERREIKSYRFRLGEDRDNQRRTFMIDVELQEGIAQAKELREDIQLSFLSQLKEHNPDYADAVMHNPLIAPMVELYLCGEGPFQKGQQFMKMR